MSQLDKRVALITAAKGGLGTRVTESFLNAGATVIGVSRSIRQSDFDHPAFHAVPAELTSGEAARQLTDEVAAKFGRIDILVHVMGGFAGGRPVADTDDATLEHMLDLNLRSAFYITRALIPHMRKQGTVASWPWAAGRPWSLRPWWAPTAHRRRRWFRLCALWPSRTKMQASPRMWSCPARWIRRGIARRTQERIFRSGSRRRVCRA
jgi:NAD(P)-dependent dehydrogenase (short-subunit alcohol dehydrogenase family)